MLRSWSTMADSNNSELIGFIGGRFEALNERFEAMSDRLNLITQRMVTKEHLDASITAVRGDIEQIHLRLDSIEHRISSRDEHLDAEISRLRSAVYVLGKDRPDVLRLLGHQSS
ncbi:MAG TPA: hypothetical protein VFX97_07415 [Pyrinomonadaceae bacterium]|nr:hypothetical protein [Pyrinomonadaceae bacterium]